MNIYLPVEVKVRELEGKTLTALAAAERGHTVILGNKKDTLNLAKVGHLPPGVVHDKSLTPGQYKIENFNRLKNHGHLITAQDEESGLLDESYNRFAKRRFSKETVSLADQIFTWGGHDQASLQEIYPDFKSKFNATGSPRVDFWRSEFDGYYPDDTSSEKPTIFFASNFGSPIDENTFWDRIARLREAGYFERDPKMEKYIYENTAYQFRLLHRFVELIREVAETFPEAQVFVRPHPVESVAAWKMLLGTGSDVIVKREGSISGIIRNSSLLIHNGCTSALEAAATGLPRIAYRPIPHPIEREIPNNLSIQVSSITEVKEAVRNILEKKRNESFEQAEKRAGEILEGRLSNLSGELAADRMVDAWTELGEADLYKTSTPKELMAYKPDESIDIKTSLKHKAVQLRNAVTGQTRKDRSLDASLKTSHKFPGLSDREMDNLVQRLQKTLNRFDDVKKERFGEKSFIFFK
jgi:surface carbohydrate biosynthesis protein